MEREKGRGSLNHHLDLKLVAYEITYGNFHNNQMYYKGCMKIYTIQTKNFVNLPHTIFSVDVPPKSIFARNFIKIYFVWVYEHFFMRPY